MARDWSSWNEVVRVEQRIIKKPDKSLDHCHIVAKKSGVITDVLTKKGVSLVTRNTYVKKDDVLISGDISFNDEIKENVCASGIVKAEVWYTVHVSLPLSYETYYKTGNKKINFAYDKGLGKTKLLKTKFKKYKDNYYKVFSLFGTTFYLVKEEENKVLVNRYQDEEAIKKAILLAMEKINIKKKEKDKIITQKVLKKSINNSTINLDVFFAVEEDIAKQEILN